MYAPVIRSRVFGTYQVTVLSEYVYIYIYVCVCFQLTYPNLLYLLCIYMQYIHIFNICLGYFEDCLGIRSTLWTSNLYKLLAVSPCRSL